MRLNDEERAMLAGAFGEPRRWAIGHQITVGEFFDAADFVPVSQAHIMADTESLGGPVCEWLESACGRAAAAERRVRVPTITDPRGTDFADLQAAQAADRGDAVDLEARAIAAFEALRRVDDRYLHQLSDDHAAGARRALAMGDTGVVIYSNSVFGARRNFEGGPSALERRR